jgi:hypothetical protein
MISRMRAALNWSQKVLRPGDETGSPARVILQLSTLA